MNNGEQEQYAEPGKNGKRKKHFPNRSNILYKRPFCIPNT